MTNLTIRLKYHFKDDVLAGLKYSYERVMCHNGLNWKGVKADGSMYCKEGERSKFLAN